MARRNPPIMGMTEIANYYGASRQLVNKWRQASDFPAPYVHLSMGTVWLTEDILAWGKRKGKRKAKPETVAA